MSLIENALGRLKASQESAAGRQPLPSGERLLAKPAGPAAVLPARQRKAVVEGVTHHVEQQKLVRGGLLPPPERAKQLAGEFRRIKRPLIANVMGAVTGAPSYSNVLMITSALPGSGKTFCALNLAMSLSLERDLNVLLVDADVAKPHITHEFGLDGARGLIDLLLDDAADVADVLVRTDLNDIHVLPAGQRHPQATELLTSARMSSIIRELATRYSDRIIVMDSPPLLVTSEAQALADQVGQITIVVDAGRTSHQELRQTVDALDRSKAVNVILNKAQNLGFAGDYVGENVYGYPAD